MMEDSGATHNFVDPFLSPRPKEFISDYRILSVPQTIVEIGEHVLKGVATGIVQGTVTDNGGHKIQFSFDPGVVPGRDPTYSLLLRQCIRGLLHYFTLTSPGWSTTTSFFR